jgi:membrane dipeptidase
MIEPIPIFDGHNDTLLNLHLKDRGSGRSFFARSTLGDLDLPRAIDGCLRGGFFAIFVPDPERLSGPLKSDLHFSENGYTVDLSPSIEHDYARRETLAMMTRLFQIEQESAGKVRVVRTIAELESSFERSTVTAILHFEGAEAISPDLSNLDIFYQAGLRSLGIVWSRPNAFGQGVPFRYPSGPDIGPGLTSKGKALVRACNERGIMLDLAHLNERGFWDVAELSEAPLVVTHAGIHAICASTRNLTDQQLDAIGATDGVIGIAYDVSMLRPDGGIDRDMPLSTIVRHIAYVADRIGVEHVALGSDFDGATMPLDLGDVAALPRLIVALQEYGFDNSALKQIAGTNWLRVLRKTWKQ